MSSLLKKRSKFYYGHNIDENNYNLDFQEGASVRTASLNVGSYSLSEFVVEIQRALNATNNVSNNYTVTLNRTTRLITISADGSFDLLVNSGPTLGTSVYSLIGFTGSDRTGSTSYVGNAASGSEFIPQFFLQNYVDDTIFKNNVQSTVLESANGDVEVVSFGEVSFVSFDCRFNTEISQPNGFLGGGGFIEPNSTALSDLNNFMNDITKKRVIEFMKDREDPNSFIKLRLESTRESRSGTGYKLRERNDLKLSGYFDTGNLKFRKVI